MPAMIIRMAAAAALTFGSAAGAVGLGPLSKQGSVAGERKAFYLTLFNPESQPQVFQSVGIGLDSEDAEPNVLIFPPLARLGPGQSRQILVIATGLAPGETRRFRVCAARAQEPEGVSIHARVCSKLAAHRYALPVGSGAGGRRD